MWKAGLDLFDEADFFLESSNQGQTWFLKEARLLRRHDAIGRSYDALRFASAFAAVIVRNPVHEESRAGVYALLRQAFTAFGTAGRPDLVYFKALFCFARDEGYPVKQEWWEGLAAGARATAAEILNQPLARQTVAGPAAATSPAASRTTSARTRRSCWSESDSERESDGERESEAGAQPWLGVIPFHRHFHFFSAMQFSLDDRSCALSVGEFAGFALGPRDAAVNVAAFFARHDLALRSRLGPSRRRRFCCAAPERHPHPKGRSAAKDGEAVAGGGRAARPPSQAGAGSGRSGVWGGRCWATGLLAPLATLPPSIHPRHDDQFYKVPPSTVAEWLPLDCGNGTILPAVASARAARSASMIRRCSAPCTASRCTCCASWLTFSLSAAISAASRERTAAVSISGLRRRGTRAAAP